MSRAGRFWITPEETHAEAERVQSSVGGWIVFSKTLKSVSWNSTNLVKGDPTAEVRKMKREPGEQMVILGSGTIVSQLAPADLIDEYQLVVIPVVLGEGRSMFEGSKKTFNLRRSLATS